MDSPNLFQVVGILLSFSIIVVAVRSLSSGFAGRADGGMRHHTWRNAIAIGAIATAIGFGLPYVFMMLGTGVSFVAYKVVEIVLLAGLFHVILHTGIGWGLFCGLVLGVLIWGVGLVAGFVLSLFYGLHPILGLVASAGFAFYPFWRWHQER